MSLLEKWSKITGIVGILAALGTASSLPAQARDYAGNVSKDWTAEDDSTSEDSDVFRKLNALRKSARKHSREGYGVVEVTSRPSGSTSRGTIVGSGTLVFIDQEPMVLTNSHVLVGRPTAQIRFPHFHFGVRATRVLDVPVADLALLRLEIPKSGRDSRKWLYAHAAAYMNARFCQPNHRSCREGIQTFAEPLESSTEEFLCAVVHGLPHCTASTAPFLATPAYDQIVSGIYRSMLSIPVFARPGMSGGAFYQSGRLGGILAKVNLGLGSYGYAIPIQEAARVIAQEHFGYSAGLTIPKSEWVGDPVSPMLKVVLGKETILSSPRAGRSVVAGGEAGNSGGEAGNSGGEAGNSGGEAGNSGGEAGNSGGEAGNSGGEAGNSGGEAGNSGGEANAPSGHPSTDRYWNLLIRMFKAEQSVMASNPFFAKPHDLRVDGRKLLAIEVRHPLAPTGVFLMVPSSATYLWMRLQNSDRGSWSWKPLWDSAESRKLLIERRQALLQKPLYARTYELQSWVYLQDRGPGDTRFESGARSLFEKGSSNNPYTAVAHADRYLDVRVDPAREDLAIRIDRDLEKVMLRVGSTPVTLERITPLETPTLLYCVKDPKSGACSRKSLYRASISWDRLDTGLMDRVLVTTPTMIHEFVACTPEKSGECVR